MIHKPISYVICLLLLSGILICGCSENDSTSGKETIVENARASQKNAARGSSSKSKTTTDKTSGSKSSRSKPVRDNTPQVKVPEASGSVVLGNEFASIDASHTEDGYFMLKYLGSNQKVKMRVTGPGQSEYIYLLSGKGEFETFPLPCGSGSYQIDVLENVGGDMYATVCTTTVDVTIKDEFGPFLYPNQYVNFLPESKTVAKGSELAKDMTSDLEVIESVYHYVTQNITYDKSKAENVSYGYLPVIDDTLKSGTGICFDYAAVMSAMLRSQGIPTKLEIGYSGEAYHAWISAYIKDEGWIDKIIEFDGKSWTLMDPTLASNNNASAVGKYIGDGSNYTVKFSY